MQWPFWLPSRASGLAVVLRVDGSEFGGCLALDKVPTDKQDKAESHNDGSANDPSNFRSGLNQAKENGNESQDKDGTAEPLKVSFGPRA